MYTHIQIADPDVIGIWEVLDSHWQKFKAVLKEQGIEHLYDNLCSDGTHEHVRLRSIPLHV